MNLKLYYNKYIVYNMQDKIKGKLNNALAIFNNIIESDECQKLIKVLKYVNDQTFIFSGVGKNWYICEKEVKTFISMGLNAKSLDCTHALHGDLGMLMNSKELKYIFFVSKSGKTNEMHKLIDVIIDLKEKNIIKNINLIMLCLNPTIEDSIDATKFDFILKPSIEFKDIANIELDDRNLIPTLSINITQSVLDYIGVNIYENNSELIENYKYNHLGGSNGRALGMEKYLEEI